MTEADPLEGKRQGARASTRFAVVQAEGPFGNRDLEAAVGTSTWVRQGGGWYVTVIVKLALEPRDDGLLVAVARPPLYADVPSRFIATDPSLLDHANDFALFKEDVDVTLVGHARARSAALQIQAAMKIVTRDGETVFSVSAGARAGAPESKIPLAAPYLGVIWAGAVGRTGPASDGARALDGSVKDGVDPRLFQWASTEMRIPAGKVRGDEAIEVAGLLDADRRLQLPGLYPFVTYDTFAEEGVTLGTRLDTIHFDTDAPRMYLAWRGTIGPLPAPDQVRRIVVSMERFSLERDERTRMSDTQRGVVRFAWTEDDAALGTPPPEEDAVLDLHRYLTFSEVAPEPRVPLERYALVSALLAEWPDRREDTLKKHGFREDSWMLEERCWLERFASDAVNGKGQLGAYYGELFMMEQDMLATPEEEDFTVRDYVAIRVAMEVGADVSDVLAETKMTLAQWMRLDRRFTARAEQDPALRHEMETLEATMRAEAEAAAEAADREAARASGAADEDE